MDRNELEGMTREELIALAERLGVTRPRVLTQAELSDEILSRTAHSERDRARARGWLGRARDLLAGVVERGLHLPDVAQILRATPSPQGWPVAPPPLATLTLAEIYAAQGHVERAIGVLDEVLARDPDHREAGALRSRLADQARRARGRSGPPGSSEADLDAMGTTERVPPAGRANGGEAMTMNDSAPESARATELAPTATPTPAERPPASAPPAAEPDEPATLRRHAEPLAPAPAARAEAAEPVPGAAAADAVPRASSEEAAPPHRPSRPPRATAPALPDRYDVDEIVAIALDPRTLYVYWEVRATTLARARARRPAGALVVRVVSVAPTWDGPIVRGRDVRVDALHGDQFVGDIEPGSSVRVSVGWMAQDEFEPFAVGVELSAPHLGAAAPIAHEVGHWSAEPSAPAPSPPPAPHAETPSLPRQLRRLAMEQLRSMPEPHVAPARLTGRAGLAETAPIERTSLAEVWTVYRTGSSELVRVVERRPAREIAGPAGIEGVEEQQQQGMPAAAGRPSIVRGRARGGASELGRGGASELARVANR
jgi:hypothetical protein